MALSNQLFLEQYIPDSPDSFVLEIECPLIDAKMGRLEVAQREVIEEKRRVAEQSGDNWHDGAFNATDNAAKVITDQATTLFRARNGNLVEAPRRRVSIGVPGQCGSGEPKWRRVPHGNCRVGTAVPVD